MLRLASDADVNEDILSGIFLRRPEFDLVRVKDVGLRTAEDSDVLEWAAAEGRILITQDRNSMTKFAYERIRIGQPMPGVFVIRNEPPFGPLIDEILLIDSCSSQEEWKDRVEVLPL
ncbi:MAG TPA: DUF5615 family PIN-like protein [Gemmataceae bacterium]|jgi:predicted nuclease of predicted toxin-antitoxin system